MNGEEGITDLVRGCILPLQEKHAELFKKEGGVFKKDLDVSNLYYCRNTFI